MRLLVKYCLNITKLKKLKDEWVKILRLQDWDIDVRFAESPTELEQTCFGRTRGEFKYKKAFIIINKPEWVYAEYGPSTNEEITLIHELLHLRFPIMIGDNADEEGIERVAEALYNLKYRGNKID